MMIEGIRMSELNYADQRCTLSVSASGNLAWQFHPVIEFGFNSLSSTTKQLAHEYVISIEIEIETEGSYSINNI